MSVFAEDGRLHRDSGPAVQYDNGSGLWFWKGVRVPEEVILRPREITSKQILAEQNAEVRRVMIERVGIERFVRESGAREVHPHEMGRLFEIDLPGDPDRVLKAVQVECPSTGRLYFLRVPPAIDRADDAVAWTFGFDAAKRYAPIAET